MAVKFSCPHCNVEFFISQAFPGSKVDCPQCAKAILVAIETQYPPSQLVKRGPQVSLASNKNAQEEALAHLEIWLDVPAPYIQNALSKIDAGTGYEIWKVPKGDSNLYREITAPHEKDLKPLQRRILDRLLYRIPVSNAAHGFIPSRSIVTNATFHLKTAGAVLNLDLKDAFPSVDALRVKHLFVRYLKIPLLHLGENISHEGLDAAIDALVKLTTYNNQLPQGGPCSGYLLNMACITLDKNIYRVLSKYGNTYRYTRYADDITVSAPSAFPEGLRAEIEKVIQDSGFQVNPKKATYAVRTAGQRLEVTGLILEKDKVRIPAAKMEVFRAIIHEAGTMETQALTAEKRLEIQSILAFIKMVYGKIPHRIWGPFQEYLQKHGIAYTRKTAKAYLDLYPHPTAAAPNADQS